MRDLQIPSSRAICHFSSFFICHLSFAKSLSVLCGCEKKCSVPHWRGKRSCRRKRSDPGSHVPRHGTLRFFVAAMPRRAHIRRSGQFRFHYPCGGKKNNHRVHHQERNLGPENTNSYALEKHTFENGDEISRRGHVGACANDGRHGLHGIDKTRKKESGKERPDHAHLIREP